MTVCADCAADAAPDEELAADEALEIETERCPRCGDVVAMRCPACGLDIPIEDWPDHEAGRDVNCPSCPAQDLELIAAAGDGQRWEPGVLPDAW